VSKPASAWALWLTLLPDAMTCGFFLIVWWNPLVFGPLSVRTAMLTMLLEFYLVHATGMFTGFASGTDLPKWKKIGALLGLSLFYLLMIGAFARSFGQWWPLVARGEIQQRERAAPFVERRERDLAAIGEAIGAGDFLRDDRVGLRRAAGRGVVGKRDAGDGEGGREDRGEDDAAERDHVASWASRSDAAAAPWV
jgi:hypothetical protein